MSTINFRRIDVDALDPDNAPSSDVYPEFPPVSINEIQSIGQEAKSLLSKGDYSGALSSALNSPPYGGDEQAKNYHLKTVIDIVTAIRSSEITPVVESLSTDLQDVLIKYLYKGMGSPLGQSHGNGGILLAWFEKTVDIAGQGSVIRYLSDRRRV